MKRFPRHPAARTPAELVEATPDLEFTISIDSRPIRALPGQSIAAALWGAGILSWRTTRVNGSPRGAFCGIGSCFDCLATVNGRPNQRACLIPAAPGDEITTQEGDGHARRLTR
ncbi:(2Fe-2S)-binding protein [Streptomyces sp. NBC_00654]|uniref:(2Fe-2S)-binding protein n=1 Tax=Streptomyces sp. NBC_00654 TaxID=2975799 RepID=UPI002253A137|nr:(2Fe-2S)-binding protein [Streptomyces sp. NBC_00654]MCX4965589.1 (2Fe-2S)-binding protein [Streptomyces sp. NBC_00654]